MNYCYNNAVVYVFCHLLEKVTETGGRLNIGEAALEKEDGEEDNKKKCYNKSKLVSFHLNDSIALL